MNNIYNFHKPYDTRGVLLCFFSYSFQFSMVITEVHVSSQGWAFYTCPSTGKHEKRIED